LFVWLVGWLAASVVDCSISWVDWLVGWLVDWFVWLLDLLVVTLLGG